MEAERKNKAKKEEPKSGFDLLSEDVVEKILRKLGALSLASAACVCKSWHRNSIRILSRPKLSSAISLNPSLDIALQEVVDKVLSEPIRPDFAIASGFGHDFLIRISFDFLAEKLGSRTPLVVTWGNGIMGRDAVTNEFKEVVGGDDSDDDDNAEDMDINSGLLLTVGCVPGLRVDAIPFRGSVEKPVKESMVDKFVMDVRNYTTSASGCTSPVGIMLFGTDRLDLRPVIGKLDYATSKETIIAGDEKTTILYQSRIESISPFALAVALVFAKDRDKPHGIGEIKFHAAISKGVSAIGPRYRTVSVRGNAREPTNTWLTARREGQQEILDGQRILHDIYDELENHTGYTDLYIGLTEHRKCRIGTGKTRLMSSLAFHGVVGGNEEYLFVYGTGIRTADYFQFYRSDPSAAASSCRKVSASLRKLRLDWSSKRCLHPTDDAKTECIGGFIFSCCGRGGSFFGSPNVDSSPLVENFPEVPLAGMFCGGEICHGSSVINAHEDGEENTPTSFLNVFSTVYLLLSYTPAPMDL